MLTLDGEPRTKESDRLRRRLRQPGAARRHRAALPRAGRSRPRSKVAARHRAARLQAASTPAGDPAGVDALAARDDGAVPPAGRAARDAAPGARRLRDDFVERNDYDLIGTLLDMNRSIYKEYKYSQGSTTVATTAFDVYANRRGVCQDFTNLFICLARLLGVPARYTCGYIYTGPKAENTRAVRGVARLGAALPAGGRLEGVRPDQRRSSRRPTTCAWRSGAATWTRRRRRGPSTWAEAPRP